jgi:hypothetical protein
MPSLCLDNVDTALMHRYEAVHRALVVSFSASMEA